MQSSTKQLPLIVAPQGGAVQLRAKTPQSSGDRLSQAKSMVLQEADLHQKPVRTHQEAVPRGRRYTFLSCLCCSRCVGTAGISPNMTSSAEEETSVKLW